MKYFALLVSALFLLPACTDTRHAVSPATVQTQTCGSIKTLHVVGDVYLASQPSAEDYALLKDRGVKAVIDLRTDKEDRGFEEGATLKALGIDYIELPWNGPDQLTDAKLDAMRKALRNAKRPVMMKCGSSNRVGAGWLAYRVLDEGVALETAVAEAKQVGLRTPAYEAKARAYISARQ
ncbi:MAG: beta-lactamase hydrolase domain-containing protein [Phycisphaeraceae bacterium]